jgi:hypothetical protein
MYSFFDNPAKMKKQSTSSFKNDIQPFSSDLHLGNRNLHNDGHQFVERKSKGARKDFSTIPVNNSLLASSDEFSNNRFINVQAKLRVNRPGDKYEQEADRVSELVAQTPEAQPGHTFEDGGIFSLSKRNWVDGNSFKKFDPRPHLDEPVGNRNMFSHGQSLNPTLREHMETFFNYDFSKVKIHTDKRAANSAQAINALAYTVGQDIVFGLGNYGTGTGTSADRKLLAHELTHVIQQQSQGYPAQVQRQQIPIELQNSVNLGTMSDEELQDRYDQITLALNQFSESTPETALLENEAGNIGIELGRREALAAGRTFSEESITRMRNYFTQNAKKPNPDSCIVALNKGVKLLLSDPKQKTTSESIEKTMELLQSSGRAGVLRVIEFEDKKGRITTGTLYPDKLHESAWDAVIQMAGNDPGWSVFGLSLMDGNHSITLTLDNNIPAQRKLYWSDQWSSKGGWKEYDRAGLDGEITRLTQNWWNDQPANRKFNTRMRLWRLQQ